ncbi:MAG: YciI family protein [Ignavibacteriae bacterium]|nr:YciI family protein [Ignavibacteriota bacterium]
MKYLCTIYIDEKKLAAMSQSDYQAVVQRCLDYEDELRVSGHMIAAEALEPIHAATTVQMRGGKMSVTDGPFAETKEQLVGFFMINAGSQDEAVRIASKMPQAQIGSIEVRPIKDLTQH